MILFHYYMRFMTGIVFDVYGEKIIEIDVMIEFDNIYPISSSAFDHHKA